MAMSVLRSLDMSTSLLPIQLIDDRAPSCHTVNTTINFQPAFYFSTLISNHKTNTLSLFGFNSSIPLNNNNGLAVNAM